MWLKYCNKDTRELYIYSFERTKQILIHTFGQNDGMISHVKFLKKKNGTGKTIIYVKDTSEIKKIDFEI